MKILTLLFVAFYLSLMFIAGCKEPKATDSLEQVEKAEQKEIEYSYTYDIYYQNGDTFRIITNGAPAWVSSEGAIYYYRPNDRERIYHYGVRRYELVRKEVLDD